LLIYIFMFVLMIGLLIFSLSGNAFAQWVVTDPGLTAAVHSQTAKQTADSIKQLSELIKNVQLMQKQVTDTQDLLKLAQKASEGIEGVEFVTDFRNIIIETNRLIKEVEEVIATGEDMPEKWRDMFGSMDGWVENSQKVFESLDVSDKVNSSGYLIADSYQDLYEQNNFHALKIQDRFALRTGTDGSKPGAFHTALLPP